MYAILAMLVIPAMLYGYDRASPAGCSIAGEVWTHAYALDDVQGTTDPVTEIPTHAGLLVREGTQFVAQVGNDDSPDYRVGVHVSAVVRAEGRRELRPTDDDAPECRVDEAGIADYWLVGERVFYLRTGPVVDAGAWQYSIEGISPVAEQVGRNIWPFVGIVLVVALIVMAAREAVK